MKLVAFIQQVTHGKCTAENAAPLGVLDVIGKDRRLAWQNLGDISKEEAMEGFVVLLDKLCPLFKTVVEALKRDIDEKKRLQKEEEVKKVEEEKRLKELEEEKQKEEEERLKQENQRRQIQEALNQQTYHQFRAYAEQQYPGNPEQQGVLIRQLQEQHYHKYMQQLHQNQIIIDDHEPLKGGDNIGELKIKESEDAPLLLNEEGTNDEDDEEEDEQQDWPPIESPQMWTKEGVEDFKSMIKKEAGDAVIKVGHGETVTVRVPTHEDGSCLFWEFATDGYDIGFGVYFEWIKPDTNQVSVHISESEDEDEDDEDYDSREDLESGAVDGEPKQESSKPFVSRISVIVPVSFFLFCY